MGSGRCYSFPGVGHGLDLEAKYSDNHRRPDLRFRIGESSQGSFVHGIPMPLAAPRTSDQMSAARRVHPRLKQSAQSDAALAESYAEELSTEDRKWLAALPREQVVPQAEPLREGIEAIKQSRPPKFTNSSEPRCRPGILEVTSRNA